MILLLVVFAVGTAGIGVVAWCDRRLRRIRRARYRGWR